MTIFNDFFAHYYTEDNPPVMVSRTSGRAVRHGGSMSRSAFWAGYDGLRGGIFPPARNGSAADSAYRAGVAYRKAVDNGTRAGLPTE
jgi:hypothetical protein